MSVVADILVAMTTLLVILNALAFVTSFGAILWAWVALRRDVKGNEELLGRLRAIDARYENSPADALVRAGGGQPDRQEQKLAEWRASGKHMFTYGEANHLPEMVKSLIYAHAASGLGAQVWLVGLGLLMGTLANVWSLFI